MTSHLIASEQMLSDLAYTLHRVLEIRNEHETFRSIDLISKQRIAIAAVVDRLFMSYELHQSLSEFGMLIKIYQYIDFHFNNYLT